MGQKLEILGGELDESPIFSGEIKGQSKNEELHIKELHAKIGELILERDFLEQASKKLGVYKKW